MSNIVRHLTAKQLLSDEVFTSVGYWPLTVKMNRRCQRYFIVKNTMDKGYTLALCSPLKILHTEPTLESLLTTFNKNFVPTDANVLLAGDRA